MQEIAADRKRCKPQLQEVSHEGNFLNEFILRPIHEYLISTLHLSPEEACKSFLAESADAKELGIALNSPMSAGVYPFKKEFSAVNSLVKSWWNNSKEPPVRHACPDFALSFPCKVVFEAKYFRRGKIDAARTELVRGIYQCFYYRGLPRVPPWDYDYACLLAYDASENWSLAKAWETVDARVKEACWNGANIFVTVLPEAK